MTCLIIDDNPMARTTLSHLCSQVGDLKVLAECSDATEAYNFLQTNDADLLFLDVEMPGMTGLELTRNLDKDVIIILTTYKRDYAVEAFDLNIVDYLLKPITAPRFLQAVTKAREVQNQNKGRQSPSTSHEFISIRDTFVTRRLPFGDIFYIEACGDYVKFHTRQKTYTVHGTLKQIEQKLPASQFMRIHRSYIIAIHKIDTLENGGVTIESKFIPVAEPYRKILNDRMNIF